MSGGVDSSTAAYLLKRSGYEVMGMHMRLWEAGGRLGSSNDGEDAGRVAHKLSIPLYIADLREEFEKEVVEYFCQEYLNARTPNPCVICNEKIKFGTLLERAKKLGAACVASGHYAGVQYNRFIQRYCLKKGKDSRKEQSYFLFSLSQKQLSHILFPLFHFTKKEVRQLAIDVKLPVHDKKESQEICFIPQKNYNEFLQARGLGSFKPGLVLDKHNRVVGEHPGIQFFTIGQRKRLSGGRKNPIYVVEIRKQENTLVIGEKEDLYAQRMRVSKVRWVSIPEPEKPLHANVKIRYQHPEAAARIDPLGDGRCKVQFLYPQRALTPGQAAVFYRKDTLLGGGWIQNVIP